MWLLTLSVDLCIYPPASMPPFLLCDSLWMLRPMHAWWGQVLRQLEAMRDEADVELQLAHTLLQLTQAQAHAHSQAHSHSQGQVQAEVAEADAKESSRRRFSVINDRLMNNINYMNRISRARLLLLMITDWKGLIKSSSREEMQQVSLI